MMMVVSMFTFRVFGCVGLHARACFYFLRGVRVWVAFASAFLTELLAWSTRPSFFRCLSLVSAPAASFARPLPCRCSCRS